MKLPHLVHLATTSAPFARLNLHKETPTGKLTPRAFCQRAETELPTNQGTNVQVSAGMYKKLDMMKTK